jgi:hypothetical protein
LNISINFLLNRVSFSFSPLSISFNRFFMHGFYL